MLTLPTLKQWEGKCEETTVNSITFSVISFSVILYESLADEKKTITPQEFAQTISEVPNKVV